MKAEALFEAIQAGDQDAVLSCVRGASEAQRKGVAARLVQRYAQCESYLWRGEHDPSIQCTREEYEAVELATLCCASLPQLKRLGYRVLPTRAAEALDDRRPDWLQEWFERVCEQGRAQWMTLRPIVLAGLVASPPPEGYVLTMLQGVQNAYAWPRGGYEKDCSLAKELLADAALLEDEVWRLFEIEGGGENSLAAVDKYGQAHWKWNVALSHLSETGQLDRSRLLRCSVQALRRDFAQFRAGWFSRFHASLEPSLDELEETRADFLALLASPIKPTLAFALRALGQLQKARRLPSQELLAHIEPALRSEAKSSVQAALRLLGAAVRSDLQHAAHASLLACEAFVHESADVHELVLKFLDKHGSPEDAALRERVSSYAEGVAPSMRKKLGTWLGAEDAGSAPRVAATAPAPLVSELPQKLCKLAGVVEAQRAQKEGRLPRPLDLERTDWPRLAAAPFERIDSVEELLLAWSRLIEGELDPLLLEQVLDGAARFADHAPEKSPLAKRANKVVQNAGAPVYEFCLLALSWLKGEEFAVDAEQGFWGLALHRMRALAARLMRGEAHALYATPTHGWCIEPLELVRRLAERPPSLPEDTAELQIALLRLAPEGRAKALKQAKPLQGDWASALRFALGGTARGVKDTALWVCAWRSRDPLGRASGALAKQLAPLGPDAAVPARIEFSVHEWANKGGHQFGKLRCVVQPALGDQLARHAAPPSAYHEEAYDPGFAPWLATCWPAQPQPFALAGCLAIANNLNWSAARWENHGFLLPWIDPDTPMGETAHWLLVCGLAAKQAREHTLAVDWAIASLEDGRLDLACAARAMTAMLPTRLIKVQRWAKTLSLVAEASPLHAFGVLELLALALRGDSAQPPRDLVKLLDLFHETACAHGCALEDPEARAYLEGIAGQSKLAKLARKILALEPSEQAAESLALAQQQALDARLERAQRWSGA